MNVFSMNVRGTLNGGVFKIRDPNSLIIIKECKRVQTPCWTGKLPPKNRKENWLINLCTAWMNGLTTVPQYQ